MAVWPSSLSDISIPGCPAEGDSVLIYFSHFGGQSTAASILIATPQVEFSGWAIVRVRTTHLTAHRTVALLAVLLHYPSPVYWAWDRRNEVQSEQYWQSLSSLAQHTNGNQFVDINTNCPWSTLAQLIPIYILVVFTILLTILGDLF